MAVYAGQGGAIGPVRRIGRRIHASLMPDYNRNATIYWWTMVLLGGGCFIGSCAEVLAMGLPTVAQVAAGTLLAMLASLVPLKIPRTEQHFLSVDVFCFTLLLLYGPAAGAIAAGLAGLACAWRGSKRWTSRLGCATISSACALSCGSLFILVLRTSHLDRPAATLVLAALGFGLIYAICDVLLMSATPRLKRGQRLSFSDARDVFGWVGAASAGSAGIAAVLFITARIAGMGVMLTVLPIMALVLTTLHYFTRQQDAEEAARRAAALAVEREAELALSQARQREAEQAAQHLRELELSEGRFLNAFTHASIGMALVGHDGRIHQANPALHRLLGCAAGALEGRGLLEFVDGADRARAGATLDGASAGEEAVHPAEVSCRRDDGTEVWASLSCSLFADQAAQGPSLILQVQDVSARHRAELELQHRASHDKLTGLANRDRFNEVLAQAIATARDDPAQGFAVLFLDFDRFKLINDSKGHTAGDEFLVKSAQRLLRCLRRGDLLARLGGDEFAILAAGLPDDAVAVELAQRLLEALNEPLSLGAMEIAATASIGITFSSIGYARPEDMLRDADIAMYRAKVGGKARYALFDVRLHTEVTQRVRLEADLRHALAAQGLAIAYQPLYDLVDGSLIGFEALSRWIHPDLGPVSPGAFIPIAEESGLITQLTGYVLHDACAQMRRWAFEHPGAGELAVHVNVAARDLADLDFVPRVRRALATSGIAPRRLVIELTENILMAELEAAMSALKALRELGVGLAVDDFGTGYSSLAHLAVLPIDSLK
ncbi:MAG: EAL domain-containing protein, partial [Burkholderiales bacterium]|nr:EAL domain-containing protein [Burkholderiales bacterium]